jgi:hypothetical protein
MKRRIGLWFLAIMLIASVSWATTIKDDMKFLGPVTMTNDVVMSGDVYASGGIFAGDSTSYLKTDTVEITNAEIKALRATPKTLVAAPGAGYVIQFVYATLIMDYGTNVLTESTDNLVIQHHTSGIDVSGSIETTGFLDQAADMILYVPPASAAMAATVANQALELFNTGDGEIAGNAGADTTLTVKITYWIHATGL